MLFIQDQIIEMMRADVLATTMARNPKCTNPDIALAFCGILYIVRWMRMYPGRIIH